MLCFHTKGMMVRHTRSSIERIILHTSALLTVGVQSAYVWMSLLLTSIDTGKQISPNNDNDLREGDVCTVSIPLIEHCL